MRTTTTSRVKMVFVPLQLSFRKAKSLHYLLLSLSLSFYCQGDFPGRDFKKLQPSKLHAAREVAEKPHSLVKAALFVDLICV